MSAQEWESERVKSIGVVFSTYAPHLRVGDKLSLDMEGDPCSLHRGGGPVEVTEIWEEKGGGRRFRAVDGEANSYDFDDMSLKPSNMWDLHPDSMADMEERILASKEGPDPEEQEAETSYRSTLTSLNAHLQSLDRKLDEVLKMQSRIDGMEENIRRMNEETTQGFRATTDTMRHFAGDVLKLAKDSSFTNQSFSGPFVEAVDKHREKEAVESAPNSPLASEKPLPEGKASSEIALEEAEFRAATPAGRSKVDFSVDDSPSPKQQATPASQKKVVFMAEGEDTFAPFKVSGP